MGKLRQHFTQQLNLVMTTLHGKTFETIELSQNRLVSLALLGLIIFVTISVSEAD